MLHLPKTLALAAFASLASASVAQAQPGMTPPGSTPPYSAPPSYAPAPGYGPQPMPIVRSGFHIGGHLSFGQMTSTAGDLACDGCDGSPPAGGAGLILGTMVSPAFAIQVEMLFNSRPLDGYGYASLTQSMFLIAGQYWITNRFWLRGGLGGAGISVSYDDGYSDSYGEGLGLMASAGYELISAPHYALDLFVRNAVASLEDEEAISTLSLGAGFTWY